ncbi:hypothetical protein RchiOBHm_Chr5g0054341 [Rosa chinensis]|uniref:Uncharacterized protein n=1 Tax=Rosa chinensis TaxID=74649 RepID=A0A2P6QG52_ROSCH|nr:hypothetical protein RchiOBHm_Chr5g0054341 [Rosa chinensis]
MHECEELMGKGVTVTSKGFDLLGRRLRSVTRQPPLSSLTKLHFLLQKRERFWDL